MAKTKDKSAFSQFVQGLLVGAVFFLLGLLPGEWGGPFREVVGEGWSYYTLIAMFTAATLVTSLWLVLSLFQSRIPTLVKLYEALVDPVAETANEMLSFAFGFVFAIRFLKDLGFDFSESNFATYEVLGLLAALFLYLKAYVYLRKGKPMGRFPSSYLGIGLLLFALLLYFVLVKASLARDRKAIGSPQTLGAPAAPHQPMPHP